MLLTLEIRDILIVDHLELEFQDGLNVLTGETGAGKSILLDCLGFVLGWRGRAELVRKGAKRGEVTAVFALTDSHPAHAILEEAGFPPSDDLILRRVNTADGRKSAWINDRRASGEVLRQVGDTLVELHGQHDDRGLLDQKGHRDLLDTFGGYDAELSEVAHHWRSLRRAKKALKEAEETFTALQEEEEYLRHAVAELDALSPEIGEEARLDEQRRLMQASEKIAGDISKAVQALGGDGAEGMLASAMRWLEGAAEQAEGRLEEAVSAIDRAMTELAEAQSGAENCLEELSFNPAERELIEDRLFAIRGLSRKHGVGADALPEFAEDMRARLDRLDHGAGNLADLRKAVEAAQASYDDAAKKLHSLRSTAARALDEAMSRELAPLKMERAEFSTQIAAGEPGAYGTDQVAFRVATNPGAPAGPLGKIASGGELSRFLLALKVCLAKDNAGLTLIFDEIDRGVGGATADAVGRRLAALAEGGQVLVVTHSPQVAALGGHHWRVSKDQREEETFSRVVPLTAAERESEIARMLSGDRITDEARAAARALLGAVTTG